MVPVTTNIAGFSHQTLVAVEYRRVCRGRGGGGTPGCHVYFVSKLSLVYIFPIEERSMHANLAVPFLIFHSKCDSKYNTLHPLFVLRPKVHDPLGLQNLFQLRVNLSPLRSHKSHHNVYNSKRKKHRDPPPPPS